MGSVYFFPPQPEKICINKKGDRYCQAKMGRGDDALKKGEAMVGDISHPTHLRSNGFLIDNPFEFFIIHNTLSFAGFLSIPEW
jgi:hypothetical protein